MTPDALKTAEVKALYEEHGSALAAYGCCCGLDFAAAEDVVQQVFLRLLEGRNSSLDAPLAYLYRAVRNASFNRRRDFRREVELPADEAWLVGGDARQEEALAVQAALLDLSEEQRETVFLKVWSGMTLQEIAGVLEIPMNTVASRYRYALDKLRERLQPVRNAGGEYAGRESAGQRKRR
ncbi:MAG: RNA polymerase sigma factor [Terriglobales bacterium]